MLKVRENQRNLFIPRFSAVQGNLSHIHFELSKFCCISYSAAQKCDCSSIIFTLKTSLHLHSKLLSEQVLTSRTWWSTIQFSVIIKLHIKVYVHTQYSCSPTHPLAHNSDVKFIASSCPTLNKQGLKKYHGPLPDISHSLEMRTCLHLVSRLGINTVMSILPFHTCLMVRF
jgi:hypothetical protein